MTGKGKVDVESSFFDVIDKTIDVRIQRGSRVAGSLLMGKDLGWSGAPTVVGCLVTANEIGARVPRRGNGSIAFLEQFPTALPDGFPDDLDLPGVTFALERVRQRTTDDPSGRIRDALLAESRRYAGVAREVMITGDKRTGRAAAHLAFDFVKLSGDNEAKDELNDLLPLMR
jgi:hypothetical protein